MELRVNFGFLRIIILFHFIVFNFSPKHNKKTIKTAEENYSLCSVIFFLHRLHRAHSLAIPLPLNSAIVLPANCIKTKINN